MAKAKLTSRSRRLRFECLEARVALDGTPIITSSDVEHLLQRASAAANSQSAIIAIVDRGGTILGVRAESGVNTSDPNYLTFAVDGAVAEARGAALFSSNAAPLTSRTVRFISQSTITQREVQSNPNIPDPNSTIAGPGLVAPIGVGGHFPPDVNNTPVADLFEIELTNRDSLLDPGMDGIKGTPDDFTLSSRFNADFAPGQSIAAPESYGAQSGLLPTAQARGIGTLPGGIPLYKNGVLVGAIGVFFPGPNGYADYEQGFVPGVGQTTLQRTNASLVLEAEWIAFAAAGGSSGANAAVGNLGGVPPVPGYDLPSGRIDLAGITLESVGPIAGPSGIQTILQVGASVGRGSANNNGVPDLPVDKSNSKYIDGTPVPEGWLVLPHSGSSLSAAQVLQIIDQSFTAAADTRAQIRLPLGSSTRMVFAVADTDGTILGLYRMPDATVFSIDVAVAKARNTVYYANPAELQSVDQVPGVPSGAAFTNRTFRYLAEPRYPEGIDGTSPGPFSILNDPGVNPSTAENVGPARPASAYTSVLGYAAFHPNRNFRDPYNIANQNGTVFFPGSTALYQYGSTLAGGFGVSGDGVSQDDVVTSEGSEGFQAPSNIRADQFFVRGVRLPYLEFPRNPFLPTPSPPTALPSDILHPPPKATLVPALAAFLAKSTTTSSPFNILVKSPLAQPPAPSPSPSSTPSSSVAASTSISSLVPALAAFLTGNSSTKPMTPVSTPATPPAAATATSSLVPALAAFLKRR